jgi:hypothetical protein
MRRNESRHYDYFFAGLAVVASPVSEFTDLIYSESTAKELSGPVACAFDEPADSPKGPLRMEIARTHSSEVLGRQLEEALKFLEQNQGKCND